MEQAPRWTIRYEYLRPGGERVEVSVVLDGRTLLALAPPPAEPPEWTRLAFHQCPNCPLAAASAPHCPVAVRLLEVVDAFRHVTSFDRVSARVHTPDRTYEKADLPVQAALSPLVGLVMVTSGCPVLGVLRPQARFHLPFANHFETAARATSLYLLWQYFQAQDGRTPDWSLEGLARGYRAISVVNRAFANRLRAAAPTDANVNALIRLDTISQAVPDIVENQLDELKFLFEGL